MDIFYFERLRFRASFFFWRFFFFQIFSLCYFLRNKESECTAFAVLTLHIYRSTHTFHDRLTKCKSDPVSFFSVILLFIKLCIHGKELWHIVLYMIINWNPSLQSGLFLFLLPHIIHDPSLSSTPSLPVGT